MKASLRTLNDLKEKIEKSYITFKKASKDRLSSGKYIAKRLENLEAQYNNFRDLHEKLINDFPPEKLEETNFMKTNALEKMFDLFLDYKVALQKYIPMSQTYTQPEEMDEDGQEEWLSEGLLTDDDNPAELHPQQEQDHSDSAIGDNSMETSNSQDNTAVSQDTSSKIDDSNIEQELTNMDNEQQNELPDELGTFLVRKPDSKASQPAPAPAQEESDGNDTDDLLRMLEDDDKTKKKKKVKFSAKEKKDTAEYSSDEDDDDFVYEGATVTRLRVAKTVLMRKKPASKAEPEDSSDETNASSDEASTVKKMFGVRKANNIAAKSTAKPHVDTPRPKVTVTAGQKPNIVDTPRPKVTVTAGKKPNIVDTPRPNLTVTAGKKPNIVDTPRPKVTVTAGKKPNIVTQVVKKAPETPPATSTPLKTYTNTTKGLQNKSILKSSPAIKNSPQASKQTNTSVQKVVVQAEDKAKKSEKDILKSSPANKNSPQASKPANKSAKKVVVQVDDKTKKTEKEFDEIINEEEFLDEDEYDLDEDFADESDGELDRRALKQRTEQGRPGQPLMRPEQLDEEMYSDGDSQSDDDSFYEDLPSSDSEDLEDWFTLDIRTERAGDYLPLLGAKAYELLLAEKQRVSARTDELRKRLEEINEANKVRSDRVRAAATALADVEDMIKAA